MVVTFPVIRSAMGQSGPPSASHRMKSSMLMMPTSRPCSSTGVPAMRFARRISRSSPIGVEGSTLMTSIFITSPTRSS